VHDFFPNAKVIGGLTYVDRADTRDATAGNAGQDACFGNAKSVWYRFTPRRDRTVVFDTRNSDYTAVVTVFTRTANGPKLYFDSCDQVASVDLKAGVTYAVMVSACCGDETAGGSLVFRARAALAGVVHLDAEGTVSHASGEATLTGTVTCNRRAEITQAFVLLRQRLTDTVLAFGEGVSERGICSRRAPLEFSIVVEPFGTTPFKAGNAGVKVSGQLCDDVACASAPEYRDIVLLRWVT
jgi:hypothetical protein